MFEQKTGMKFVNLIRKKFGKVMRQRAKRVISRQCRKLGPMKNCVDTFPEVPRIGDGRRNKRRVLGPYGFYDCSMIQIGSRAKVSKIFRQ